MEKTETKIKTSTWQLIRQILGYYKHYKLLFSGVLGSVLLANALELAKPKILGHIVDRVGMLSGAPGLLMHAALVGGLWYLAASLASAGLNFLYGRYKIVLEQCVLCDLRTAIFSKIQSLGYRYHDNNHSGGLITKATRDIDQVRAFFGDVAFEIIQFGLIVGGSFIVIMTISWKLALLCYAIVPLSSLIIYQAAQRLRNLFKEADDEYDGVTEILRENITGIRVVRAFGQEPCEIGKFDKKVDSFFSKVIRSVDHFSFHLPLAHCLFGTSSPLVLCAGGFMVMKGWVTLGDLTACMFYLSVINRKMRMMDKIVDRTQNAVASADRINQILNAADEIPEGKKLTMPEPRGAILFEKVSFEYETGKPVLKEVDLEIAAGETVAFVGPTGSGKSTAAMLLPRFYDITSGTIRFDGMDVRDLGLPFLRAQVGFVFQEPFLFSDTIQANIAYGRPEADKAAIEQAAKEARIHEFIMTLETGYDAMLGERGINLSGGQKQRLTIARAILMNPPVLVLDDCTSSLDAVTEREIRVAMETVAARRTTIIVAQRISTVRRADRIVVFDHGRIVQTGKHEDLIGVKGVYRDLFFSQSFTAGAAKGEAEEAICTI